MPSNYSRWLTNTPVIVDNNTQQGTAVTSGLTKEVIATGRSNSES